MTPTSAITSFRATEERIDTTCRQFGAFPRQPAVLVRLIKHIHKQVRDSANVVLRRHDLNHTTYNILMMLYGSASHRITPSELGAATGEKAANVTRVCNDLAERGWIERVGSCEDRRKVDLTLTPDGVALIESFLPAMTDVLDAQVAGLDADQMQQLEHLLKQMLMSVEQLDDGGDTT